MKQTPINEVIYRPTCLLSFVTFDGIDFCLWPRTLSFGRNDRKSPSNRPRCDDKYIRFFLAVAYERCVTINYQVIITETSLQCKSFLIFFFTNFKEIEGSEFSGSVFGV